MRVQVIQLCFGNNEHINADSESAFVECTNIYTVFNKIHIDENLRLC